MRCINCAFVNRLGTAQRRLIIYGSNPTYSLEVQINAALLDECLDPTKSQSVDCGRDGMKLACCCTSNQVHAAVESKPCRSS